MTKRINRIAVFIDHDNFSSAFKEKFKLDEIKMEVWEELNGQLLKAFQDLFPFEEIIDHIGTWLCIGISEKPKPGEERFIRHLHHIDCINCFNVKYGVRTYHGKEKGVDTEIICQMLEYAILDKYDNCILLSDDADYIPAVNRIQDRYGKKVIQAGYRRSSRLRGACFGNIKLEKADEFLNLPMTD